MSTKTLMELLTEVLAVARVLEEQAKVYFYHPWLPTLKFSCGRMRKGHKTQEPEMNLKTQEAPEAHKMDKHPHLHKQ